jgi:hypothetical protein
MAEPFIGDPIGDRTAELQPGDVLILRRRRILSRHERTEEGMEALRVFYRDKDITFDLPETVAFGRRLIQQERFKAGEAMGWSDGAPLPWDDVCGLLGTLLEEGVLERENEEPSPDSPPAPFTAGTDPDGLLPEPRWRTTEELCAVVSAHLKQEIDPARLEATLGAALVGMAATDEQGRQGENTLALLAPFLADLVPTEWARCRFSGSRFEEARPMNVSAMRQVRHHFEPLLQAMAAIRARLLARAGRSPADLIFLAILSDVFFMLGAWVLVRPGERVRNGELPAWLTSLQKTAAGIGLPVRELLFFSRELPFDEAARQQPDAARLLRVSEESLLFMSATGVCAGPPAMVQRALQVFTGQETLDGAGAPLEALGDLDGMLDYALAAVGLEAARLYYRASTQAVVERVLDGQPTGDLTLLRWFLDASSIPPGGAARCSEACAAYFEGTLALGAGAAPSSPPPRLTLATPLEEIAARLTEGRADSPWAPAFLEILAIEKRAQETVTQLQAKINDLLGRSARPRVTRTDLNALPRLRGETLPGDAMARLLNVTVREQEDRYLLVNAAATR